MSSARRIIRILNEYYIKEPIENWVPQQLSYHQQRLHELTDPFTSYILECRKRLSTYKTKLRKSTTMPELEDDDYQELIALTQSELDDLEEIRRLVTTIEVRMQNYKKAKQAWRAYTARDLLILRDTI